MCFKTFLGILRSSAFLGCYVAIFRYLLCFFKNTRHKIDRWNVIGAGFFCSVALLVEPEGRRTEIALYLVPRVLDGLWKFARKRQWVTPIKYGEIVLFAIAMAIIMYCYQNEEQNIKPTYLSIFKKFWGTN